MMKCDFCHKEKTVLFPHMIEGMTLHFCNNGCRDNFKQTAIWEATREPTGCSLASEKITYEISEVVKEKPTAFTEPTEEQKEIWKMQGLLRRNLKMTRKDKLIQIKFAGEVVAEVGLE